jgi:hypothetical protein
MPRGPRTKRWQSSARLTALFRLCRSGSSSGSRINNFSDSRRRPKDGSLYWVLSDAKIDNKHMMWNQPVDLKGADASVTLDGRNAMPVA